MDISWVYSHFNHRLGMQKIHTIVGIRTSGRGTRWTGIELARAGQGSRSGGTRASAGLVHSRSGKNDLQISIIKVCVRNRLGIPYLITSSRQHIVLITKLSNCPTIIVSEYDILSGGAYHKGS